jgi:hypothetical protein
MVLYCVSLTQIYGRHSGFALIAVGTEVNFPLEIITCLIQIFFTYFILFYF